MSRARAREVKVFPRFPCAELHATASFPMKFVLQCARWWEMRAKGMHSPLARRTFVMRSVEIGDLESTIAEGKTAHVIAQVALDQRRPGIWIALPVPERHT